METQEYLKQMLTWIETWKPDQIETSETFLDYFKLQKNTKFWSTEHSEAVRMGSVRSILVTTGVVENLGSYKSHILRIKSAQVLKREEWAELESMDARINAYKIGPNKIVRRS